MSRPIVKQMEEVKDCVVEREEQVKGVYAALLSRQHVVFVGPPGTAKSRILERIVRHMGEMRIFERLLFETTPTEEVLGPLSLKGLKEDRYVRVTRGKIQEADIAYLEEVFNANDPILHALQRLVNERVYDTDDGPVTVPLLSVVAATNVVPTKPTLMAIYDRFQLRYMVPDIMDDANFRRMLTLPETDPVKTNLTRDDLTAAQTEVAGIPVPDSVLDGIVEIRRGLRKEGFLVSPRRYKWTLGVLKASAYLNGRDEVDMDDLTMARHMYWSQPGDLSKVSQVVYAVAAPALGEIETLYDDALRDYAERSAQALKTPDKRMQLLTEWLGRVNTQVADMTTLIDQMKREGRDTTHAQALADKLAEKGRTEMTTALKRFERRKA